MMSSERAHLSSGYSCREYDNRNGQRSLVQWVMHMKPPSPKVHPSADLRSHSFLLSHVSSGSGCFSRKKFRLNVLSSSAGDSRVPPEADVHYRRSGAAAMSPACTCLVPPSSPSHALQARFVCAACLQISTSVPQMPCSRSSLYHSCSCFASTGPNALTVLAW